MSYLVRYRPRPNDERRSDAVELETWPICIVSKNDSQLVILFIYLFYQTYTYKIIQYENEPYSDNNEQHASVALTDAQHEIKLVNNYNETLKTILHNIQ